MVSLGLAASLAGRPQAVAVGDGTAYATIGIGVELARLWEGCGIGAVAKAEPDSYA